MKRTHGKTGTRVYQIWYGMKQRCHYVKHIEYHRYGAKGIRVCDEWHGFESFYKDMGDPPDGMTLDRIDGNKDYCKDNCRWATTKEQSRNRKSFCHFITHNGKTKTLTEWAEEMGMPRERLKDRIVKLKWSPERALTTPKLRD